MIKLLQGDAFRIPLDDGSVHCVVTSPPYWGLRDYGIDGQIGLESTLELYVQHIVEVFREVWRVLHETGTVWLNMGDSYATGTTAGRQEGTLNLGEGTNIARKINRVGTPARLKTKDLCMIPARVALALQADGWYLRSDIIWHKTNPMPESVTDRPTKSHEYVFLLTKKARYFYDADAIREDSIYPNDDRKARSNKKHNKRYPTRDIAGARLGSTTYPKRNKRSVWTIPTAPYSGAHFATFPPTLIEPMIKAGTSEHGACPECGRQCERVTEVISRYIAGGSPGVPKQARGKFSERQGTSHSDREGLTQSEKRTIGWQPTCECHKGEYYWCSDDLMPVPSIVLDPFVGSGTVLQVARQLGRSAVGIDLSYEYLGLARERLSLDKLDAWITGKDGRETEEVADLPLFQETPS